MSQMLDYVIKSLKASDVEAVEKDTGFSVWTLRAIRQKKIKNPGIKSIEPLYRYFKDQEGAKLRRRSA